MNSVIGDPCKASGATGYCDVTNTCVPNRFVFVTDGTYEPDTLDQATSLTFDSVKQADAICQKAASNAGLSSKVTWRAWISDMAPGDLVEMRLASSEPELPWALLAPGNPEVATDLADLIAGGPERPINISQYRGTPTGSTLGVWTGTEGGGAMGPACGGWDVQNTTGIQGNFSQSTAEWTYASMPQCTSQGRFYCFLIQ